MADTSDPTPLSRRIRSAAKRAGGMEKLRKLTGLSTGTFYGLLAGAKAQRNPTQDTLQKLADAGVRLPDRFLRAA